MADSGKGKPFSYSKAARSLQENAVRSGTAAAGSYTLIGAIVLFGGLGYGFDYWRGTSPWGVFLGLLLGIIVGFYELIKTTFRRR
jgi:F0F1-type ATP synthase assembly protein I